MLYRKFKRLLDILASACALFLLWPLMGIVALLVRCTSKGPAIFRQTRLGKDGKEFQIYKFRSMCVGAEKTGTGVYSGKGDARVTKIGRILRATSIDELPQLWNIFKGGNTQTGNTAPCAALISAR